MRISESRPHPPPGKQAPHRQGTYLGISWHQDRTPDVGECQRPAWRPEAQVVVVSEARAVAGPALAGTVSMRALAELTPEEWAERMAPIRSAGVTCAQAGEGMQRLAALFAQAGTQVAGQPGE